MCHFTVRLGLLIGLAAGCAPMAYSQRPFAQQQAQPQAAPDTRNAGQVIVDIIATQGYTCTAGAAAWACVVPSSPWPLYVAYVPAEDGSNTIWFDSYLDRAFAQRCDTFVAAVQDLLDAGQAFTASCDDSSKKFRFHTAVAYGPEMDVMAWVHAHEASRMSAGNNLRGIQALSRDAAQLVTMR